MYVCMYVYCEKFGLLRALFSIDVEIQKGNIVFENLNF